MWTLYTPCVSVAISGDFCHKTAGKCTKFTCLAFELFAMNATPARRVTPPLDVYMVNCHPGWQGYPTYHVNVIKIKGEIIWKGGLPHLGRLPQLPGVPHLHVNRPYLPIVILLTVCHTILMMLVRRICYWINLNNPLNDTFLYSHHFFCLIDIELIM